jgi:acyl-CoA thioesterase-1
MIAAADRGDIPRQLWFRGHRVNSAIAPVLALALALLMVFPGMGHAAGPDPPIRIVAFGDSLTAGFQLPPSKAFPVQLEAALRAKGHRVEVVNAGVSGDTTASGLARFDWAIPDGTDAVIVEFGANDALRGVPPAEARRNLEAIVTRLKARKAEVVIAGMHAPRNWGEGYVREFDAIFPELAGRHGLILYPFFLEGVALRAELSLPDGLHPNAKGVAQIVRNILPTVEQLIERVKARRAGRV